MTQKRTNYNIDDQQHNSDQEANVYDAGLGFFLASELISVNRDGSRSISVKYDSDKL